MPDVKNSSGEIEVSGLILAELRQLNAQMQSVQRELGDLRAQMSSGAQRHEDFERRISKMEERYEWLVRTVISGVIVVVGTGVAVAFGIAQFF